MRSRLGLGGLRVHPDLNLAPNLEGQGTKETGTSRRFTGRVEVSCDPTWRAQALGFQLLANSPALLNTLHYTILYTIYYILYTIYYILYTIYYILYTIYYIRQKIILYAIHYTLYTIHYTLYTIYYTIPYYTMPYHTIPYHTKDSTTLYVLYYNILHYII